MNPATRASFFVFALALMPCVAFAADLWVAPTGTDAANDCRSSATACATIQHAVDVAADNDTIRVVAGTYAQHVVIDKKIAGLTVRGGYTCAGGGCTHSPDPDLTVIEGTGASRVVSVSRHHAGAGDIRFEYLTIRNGSHGGLGVSGGSGSPSRIVVANSVVADNTTSGYGGGVAVSGNDVILEIVDSTIRDNSAQRGGGVSAVCGHLQTAVKDVQLIIRRSRIQANDASADGGGVYAESSTTSCTMRVEIQSSVIGHENLLDPFSAPVPNHAYYGGGICFYAAQSGVVEVDAQENTINANTANGRGAGVLSSSSDSGTVRGRLDGNIMTWNAATYGAAALAVSSYNSGKQSLRFDDNLVSLNDGTPAGIGVQAWSGALVTFDMRRNWVLWNGNAILEGALFLEADAAGTRIDARLIGNGIAANARGIDLQAMNAAVVDAYLVNNYIVDHTTTHGLRLAGVGIDLDSVGGTARVTGVNNTVTNNGTAQLASPGITVQSAGKGGVARLELTNSIVWGNGSEDIYITENESGVGSSAYVSARHCDIGDITTGAPPASGTYVDLGQNISQDPLFVDPGAANYEISAGPPMSPAANAGLCDTAVPPAAYERIAPFLDFEGDPRPPSPTLAFLCDMGADEIDHCTDKMLSFDESGVDCGGNRCAPCGCAAAQHVMRVCPPTALGYDDVISAYGGLTAACDCTLTLHRMEFRGPHVFTNRSSSGETIRVKVSGGWNCLMSSRSSGDYSTLHGKVVIGGDTLIEADGLAIR